MRRIEDDKSQQDNKIYILFNNSVYCYQNIYI